MLAAGKGGMASNSESWVHYRPGDLPLVLTIPHDGTLKPGALPTRQYGATLRDKFTGDLAWKLAATIHKVTGRNAHVIWSDLHRSRVDFNRGLEEGAQGHPVAEKQWHDYHRFARTAHASVAQSHGRGLWLDLHGHSHGEGMVELGYGLSVEAIADMAECDCPAMCEESTIRRLQSEMSCTAAELISGARSLGSLLQHSARTFPSPSTPSISQYFSGGYTVQTYGSSTMGAMDAVQVEVPQAIRFDPDARAAFAEALGVAVVEWLRKMYHVDLRAH